ncbi:MAG: hypothetical protein PW792_01545 [Acidobacteriaceae bacterium]|nr:hypothetical protein [Acidobacteriaceae bacterium]
MMSTGARSTVVNRTHRVIREKANTMREQRDRRRSLWLPLMIFSPLLLGVCYAGWMLAANYDTASTGMPDSSDQLFIMLVWSLPITAAILGSVWLRRERLARDGGDSR